MDDQKRFEAARARMRAGPYRPWARRYSALELIPREQAEWFFSVGADNGGSAILYNGRLGGELYRFGTSGLLYRSNKLMYDRTTRTLWNQFTGAPAWGPLVGQGLRLTSLPVV